MDEVVVRRWCDLCAATEEGRRVGATQRYEMVLRKGAYARTQPRTVDTCDTHAAQLDELWALVKRVAVLVPVESQAQEGDKLVGAGHCPLCDKDVRWLTPHLTDLHKASVKQPAKCPDCGKKATSTRGMVVHRRAHGYDYVAELVASVPKRRR